MSCEQKGGELRPKCEREDCHRLRRPGLRFCGRHAQSVLQDQERDGYFTQTEEVTCYHPGPNADRFCEDRRRGADDAAERLLAEMSGSGEPVADEDEG